MKKKIKRLFAVLFLILTALLIGYLVYTGGKVGA